MSFVIISSSTKKAMEFAKQMHSIYQEFCESLPDKTIDGDRVWVRAIGESNMRRISFHMTATVSELEQGARLTITYGYGMGSNMDCLCESERFIIGFKKFVAKKLDFQLKCQKYDKNDEWAICGHPSVGLNVFIDSEKPCVFCVDPRHQPLSMGPSGCFFETISSVSQ